MAIKQVNTISLLEEIDTDGHSPMKFLCDDYNVYYCKYRSGRSLNADEFDFLAYEIICHFLLIHLKIPTPEIALVHLQKGSFSSGDLRNNRKYAIPGVICFGSQEVPNSNLVTGLELISDKREFNRYENPEDIIRIAFFDLWVGNIDRGRDENFNLLTKIYNGKIQILAFDQAFAFHGEGGLRVFNPSWPLETRNNLAKTAYFKGIIQYIPEKDCIAIAEKMLDWRPDGIKSAVDEAFSVIPDTWRVSPRLKERMIDFLLDESRLDTIRRESLFSSIKSQK